MTAIDLLLATVERSPDRPALVCPDGTTLTYEALAGRAAALADWLRSRAAGPGARVMLHVEADEHWVIGVWAAWLAGAAVAPVATGTPAARVASLRARIDPVAVLDHAPPGSAAVDRNTLPMVDDLAWLIHSSGSTGQPKGVRVTHRGVQALVRAQCEAFALAPDARVLAVLSPAFDASLSDLLTAHASGACLVLGPRGVLGRPAALLEWMGRQGVTHADLPPSVVARIDPARLPACVRTVVMGGEVCPPDQARAWARRVRLVSVYGPTEATICTSMVQVDPARWERPDIGEPLPGVRYRLGPEEELWIGGPCLAEGYTDPTLTAQRFVFDEGERWFRTGDRVARSDGRWIFVGRMDRMVKLQGRLAHPEELERLLADSPGVARAAAWAEGGRLHATVVGTTEGLMERCREQLPSWMVPATLTEVTHMAETPSGKVDLSRAGGGRSVLAALWSKALGHPVQPEDDLDAAGRDSFAILELLSASDRLQLGLTPELVATASTCEQMAAAIQGDPVQVATLRARAGRAPRVGTGGLPRHVLVTGGTGTLGRAVVPLLRAGGLEITLLVRPGAPVLDLPSVVGDLAAPRLGLDAGTWERLASACDTVLHLGARLDALGVPEVLWETNVEGTRRILALAAAGRPAVVHHASTLAVFACGSGTARRVSALDPLPAHGTLLGAYPQSKWAAEALAEGAGARVHRLALLVPTPCTGLLRQVIRGLAALQPEGPVPEVRCNLTPLEPAARVLADAVLSGAGGRTHIAAPTGFSLPQLVERVRGRRVDASPLERALAERVLLAPFARHPSNLFLSTGWDWGGTLPAGPRDWLDRLVDGALEAR